MKIFVLTLVIVLVGIFEAESLDSEQIKNIYNEYKAKYIKEYNERENKKRITYFKTVLLKIIAHNERFKKGQVNYTLGLNQFSDWSHDEQKNLLGFRKPSKTKRHLRSFFEAPENETIPEEVNWVERGAVTKIKNQSPCGTCYIFSANGALEGQHFRKTGKLISASEQEVFDCLNRGCDQGGDMEMVYNYGSDHGIAKYKDYPYAGAKGECRREGKERVFNIHESVLVDGDEEMLKAAVGLAGPISIGLDFNKMMYLKGDNIFDDECECVQPNHAVLIVGYGTEKGKDYWLIKNSWGTNWGNKGYFKMARGKNLCCITSYALYPGVN